MAKQSSNLILYSDAHLTPKERAFRAACESRFAAYVRAVAPWLVLGHIHDDVSDELQQNYEKNITHQLELLPRGHLKSTLLYLFATWLIIKNPAITIIYASASHTLAELQLFSMKQIIASSIVMHYWPGLLNIDEGKRKVWRQTEIAVDHPSREQKGVRDYTMRSIAIGHNVTGAHCDVLMLDDVVAPESAEYSPWSDTGRQKLETWYSFMSSVLNPDGHIIAVGTRYHNKDLYNVMMKAEIESFGPTGELLSKTPLFVFRVETVETNGQFLWPRTQGVKGNWEGFDWDILNKKKATYADKAKFYSQYYQNPVDPESSKFVQNFQYYDNSKLVFRKRHWYLKSTAFEETLLNVYSAIDIAYTTNRLSDFTALTTIGIDSENKRYILDIQRVQTDRLSILADLVFNVFSKWTFSRIRVESTAAQIFFVTLLRDEMRKRNIFFNLEEFKPQLKKQERIVGVLEPLYKNNLLFHYRGGNCQLLEEELVMQHPPHDDIADSLASVNEIAVRPTVTGVPSDKPSNIITFHPKFGGVDRIA